jgi:hypothetical protein
LDCAKIWIVLDLDRARFGSCKIWIVQDLDRARFGSCKIWIVQDLGCADLDLSNHVTDVLDCANQGWQFLGDFHSSRNRGMAIYHSSRIEEERIYSLGSSGNFEEWDAILFCSFFRIYWYFWYHYLAL